MWEGVEELPVRVRALPWRVRQLGGDRRASVAPRDISHVAGGKKHIYASRGVPYLYNGSQE
jgi:hypothetical protein